MVINMDGKIVIHDGHFKPEIDLTGETKRKRIAYYKSLLPSITDPEKKKEIEKKIESLGWNT